MLRTIHRAISIIDNLTYTPSRLQLLTQEYRPYYPSLLKQVEQAFHSNGIVMTNSQPKPTKTTNNFVFQVQDNQNIPLILASLSQTFRFKSISISYEPLSWFPRHKNDLQLLDIKTNPHYTSNRVLEMWTPLMEILEPLHQQFSSIIYLELKNKIGLTSKKFPNIYQIGQQILKSTGFQIKQIDGILDCRSFFNHLAFKVFPLSMTSKHLIGILPLLANKSFTRVLQQFGLASLGCSEKQLSILQQCYGYSVERGLLGSNAEELKIIGASLNSSVEHLRSVKSLKKMAKLFEPISIVEEGECAPLYYIEYIAEWGQGLGLLNLKRTFKTKNPNGRLCVTRNIHVVIHQLSFRIRIISLVKYFYQKQLQLFSILRKSELIFGS